MRSKIKLIPKPPRRTAYEGNMTRTAKTPERNNINNTPNKQDLFQKELYSIKANQIVTNNKLDKLNEKISHNTAKLNEQSTLLKSMATALNQQTYLLGSIKKSIDNLSMNIQAVLRRLPNNSPSLKDSLNNSGNTSFSQKSKCSAKYNRRNNRK